MWQLLDRLDTKTLSAALSRAVADGDCTAESLRTLLLAVPAANESGRKTTAALAALQNALWLHEDAMNLSVRGWLIWRNDESLRACCAAILAGGLQEKLWADFDPAQKEKGLFAVTYGAQRDAVMLLYVRLAAMMNTPGRLAGKVALADPEKSPEADAVVSGLAGMRLAGEAVRILENASGPRSLYLRSVAQSAAGDAKKAADDRAAAMKALDEAVAAAGKDKAESVLYEMAEIMARHNDAGAEAFYRKITGMAPENSVYDSNAWLRLGQMAESRREYGRAAECYEKTVEAARKGGFFFSITGDDGESCYGDAAFELMRRRIDDLRAKGK
jgi:tetratricopeptide (TPR) repeat protein